MMDHRWIVASLIEMHDYAERFDLDGVATELAALLEKVSPALGGALVTSRNGGANVDFRDYIQPGSNVVALPERRVAPVKVNA